MANQGKSEAVQVCAGLYELCGCTVRVCSAGVSRWCAVWVCRAGVLCGSNILVWVRYAGVLCGCVMRVCCVGMSYGCAVC